MIEQHTTWLAGLVAHSLDSYLLQALPWLLPLLIWGWMMDRSHRQLARLRRQTARLVLETLLRHPNLDDTRVWHRVQPAFEQLVAGGLWLPAAGNLWCWPANTRRAERLCEAGPGLVRRVRQGRLVRAEASAGQPSPQAG